MKYPRSGFTLVELVMVIALISIIATLAISRLSGVRTHAEKKLNLANLGRIGAAMDTYMILHPDNLNRLDAPFLHTTPALPPGTVDFSAFYPVIATNTASPANTNSVSLCPELCSAGTTSASNAIFCTYALSENDTAALHALGLQYLMCGTTGDPNLAGDDGAWAQGEPGDPDLCCSVARSLTNGTPVAAINPAAVALRRLASTTDPGLSPVGAYIYQSCGQDVRRTPSGHTQINGLDCGDSDLNAWNALRTPNGGGILLAFGIGQYASCIGSSNAGLDSAPVCPITNAGEYRRYFLLIRLLTASTGAITAEYAGIMDAKGQTAIQLRAAAR